MKLSSNATCPCGSGLKHKKCCGKYHQGEPAPTPEALMRSRYSAYALHKVEYIMQTTHPDSPHFESDRVRWHQELELFCQQTRFANLSVQNVEGDTVTFRAMLFQGAQDVSFTERSLFRQLDGRWLYDRAI
jgi:SEC-C motif domain protein